MTPVAGTVPVAGGAAGSVSALSTAVAASAVANGWRRFWPVSLMIRSALAAGLKSTPKDLPLRATVSWRTLVAAPLASSMRVDATLVSDAVELAVLHAVVDTDEGGVALQAGDGADHGGGPRVGGVEADQLPIRGQADGTSAAAFRGDGSIAGRQFGRGAGQLRYGAARRQRRGQDGQSADGGEPVGLAHGGPPRTGSAHPSLEEDSDIPRDRFE